jgi:glutathione S-transferase
MSLWTPGGEVPVNRNPEPTAPPADTGVSSQVGGPDLEDLTPEERAQAEAMVAQMAEAQRQILAAPAALIVANHLMGLYELAAIHLSQEPPNLAEARLAIDAMAAVLDAIESRLGEDGPALRQALVQLQMAFLHLTDNAEPS